MTEKLDRLWVYSWHDRASHGVTTFELHRIDSIYETISFDVCSTRWVHSEPDFKIRWHDTGAQMTPKETDWAFDLITSLGYGLFKKYRMNRYGDPHGIDTEVIVEFVGLGESDA
jgi:hypothetical protein